MFDLHNLLSQCTAEFLKSTSKIMYDFVNENYSSKLRLTLPPQGTLCLCQKTRPPSTVHSQADPVLIRQRYLYVTNGTLEGNSGAPPEQKQGVLMQFL